MSVGIPVVTTPVGAMGLKWAGMEDLYRNSMAVAECVPEEFANTLTDVYMKKER